MLSKETKAALIGAAAVLLAAILTIYYTLKPGEPEFALVDVTSHEFGYGHGTSLNTILDIKVRNTGQAAALVERVRVDLKDYAKLNLKDNSNCANMCHALTSSETYNIDLSDLVPRMGKTLNIPHLIKGDDAERINIRVGGSESFVATAFVELFFDGGYRVRSKSVPLIVVAPANFHGSKQTDVGQNKIDPSALISSASFGDVRETLRKYGLKAPDWL